MRQPLGLIFQAERGRCALLVGGPADLAGSIGAALGNRPNLGRHHRDEVGMPPLLSCNAD
jgi:hypothetical protein